MATVTVSSKKKPGIVTVSSKSSGSSSSGRVPANSYGNGDKYVGGDTIKKADGSTETIRGEYTSPSGKVTYTDDDGNVKVVKSSDKSQIGTTFNADGTIDKDYEMIAKDYGIMQMQALQAAQEKRQDAIDSAYRASANELNNSVADFQRQAYVNQQRALKNLPQTMAAAGYTGGVTETNAANISNEYQNALTDIERARAQELARLQANRANGIAESNAQYDIQMANMLQQAQQYQRQQEQWDEEMKLRQAAAALEEERVRNQINLANREQALAEQKFAATQANGGNGTLLAVPTSLTAATQQSIAGNNMEPLMAYYKSQGWSDADILAELNRYRVDPESAFYGYR